MPLLLFPVLSVLTLILDWSIGDSGRILQILHSSKIQFLYEYLIDWKDSLLLSCIVIWLIFVPIFIFMRNRALYNAVYLFVIGTSVWVGIGLFFYQLDLTGIFLVSMTGIILQSGLFIMHSKLADA